MVDLFTAPLLDPERRLPAAAQLPGLRLVARAAVREVIEGKGLVNAVCGVCTWGWRRY